MADCSLSTLARMRGRNVFRWERVKRDRYLYELASFEPWARAYYAQHTPEREARRIANAGAGLWMTVEGARVASRAYTAATLAALAAGVPPDVATQINPFAYPAPATPTPTPATPTPATPTRTLAGALAPSTPAAPASAALSASSAPAAPRASSDGLGAAGLYTVDSDGSVWIDASTAERVIGCSRHTLIRARGRIRHRNMSPTGGNGARYLYERTDVEAYARAFRQRKELIVDTDGTWWITAAEAKLILGCTWSTLRRNRDKLRFRDVNPSGENCGARYLYDRASVEAFADEKARRRGADATDAMLERLHERMEDEDLEAALAAIGASAPASAPVAPAPTTPATCGHFLAPLCGCQVHGVTS